MTFEESLILLVIAFIGAIGVIFLLKVVGAFGKKVKKITPKDRIEESYKRQTEVVSENYLIEINQLKKDKQSMYGKMNRLQAKVNKFQDNIDEGYEDEDDADLLQSKYEIVPEKAVEYAKKLGFNVDALNNPSLTPLFWSKVKDNVELALTLGIIRPIGTGQTVTSSPESTNSNEAFIKSITAQGNLA